MQITSVQNPLIKQAMALRDPKMRKATGLTLIDGLREIQRALEAGVAIETIFYCPKFIGNQVGLKLLAAQKKLGVEVADKVFEKIAYGERAEGVIAVARISFKHFNDLKLPENPLVVVIESIEKPGNLGAVLRTCDGAGVDALLVCTPQTDIYNPNVIRASIGTVFTVPVAVGTKEDVIAFLRKHKIKALGAFPDANGIYTRTHLKGPLAIVLGTEDEGLSFFWQKHCDMKVKIPMKGRADSLNVSVSAAIIIYEALRQRQVFF